MLDLFIPLFSRLFSIGPVPSVPTECPINMYSCWLDLRAAPAYIAVSSLLLLLVKVWRRRAVHELDESKQLDTPPTVALFNMIRLLGTAALAIQSALSIFRKGRRHVDLSAVSMTITELYVLLLSLLSVNSSSSLRPIVSHHVSILLFAIFSVYVYRDLWPLVTFTQSPRDSSEGLLLWMKIGILSLIGLVIPLVTPGGTLEMLPRIPDPVDKVSLWSQCTYSYLDPLIFRAYKKGTIISTDLPVLGGANLGHSIVDNSFHELDPYHIGSQKRYLLWGFLSVFKTEYAALAALQILQICSGFVSPLGVKYLLLYIETNGRGATIRPWFWISWLFLGPFLRAIISQRYTFISTRIRVRMEAILTQLIFTHALRLRLDSEESNGGQNSEQGKHLLGKINNLATSDSSNISSVVDIWLVIVFAPLQIALSIWFLYDMLEWSALVGLGVILLGILPTALFSRLLRNARIKAMKNTDARVQKVVETMSIARMIKLFGWELKVEQQIAEAREEEISSLRKIKLIELVIMNFNFLVPLLAMIATYTIYTVVMCRELTASRVFSSIAIFEILRQQFRIALDTAPNVIQGKVSLDRLDDFIKHTEVLDHFRINQILSSSGDMALNSGQCETQPPNKTGFHDAQFSWSPDPQSFKLTVEGQLVFETGITLITGPTASGKTSLLMALLGEMRFAPLKPCGWFHLARAGGVAYAAQESWVQSKSIRDNILFGSAYEENRYRKVIRQCALESDFALFEHGDGTEVGEKGVTLSGGQKARITLARAIYSHAMILLLDDVLAALDANTANWIVEKCLAGDLLEGRTVLLVTHNIALASIVAHAILRISPDGFISSDALTKTGTRSLLSGILSEEDNIKILYNGGLDIHGVKASVAVRTLTEVEQVDEGDVGWSSFKLYFSNLSAHPSFFWACLCGAIFLYDIMIVSQSWLLGQWASQYEYHDPSEVAISFYLSIYIALIGISSLLFSFGYAFFYISSLKASRRIHGLFIKSVLGSVWRWLDTTPTARVIARATQDIRTIDGELSQGIKGFTDQNMMMLARLGSIVLITPAYIIPGVAVGCIGAILGRLYMKAQLQIKRQRSNAKSPVLGHFAAAMAGLVSIRAYGAQTRFLEESITYIDEYTRTSVVYWDLNRWISVRSDTLGGVFTAGLGAYLVYGPASGATASTTGFSLVMAVTFSAMILAWVRMLNSVELSANSLERVAHYTAIEQELQKGIIDPPAYWPASGSLQVENLSAKYSTDGPYVLHGLSFEIKSGEHVGIVGRTGAGKSSLTLALLRCIPTTGEVYYDGIPTGSIDLTRLRSNITIIPQNPDLLSGTLRDNLDPFSEFDSLTLHEALRSAGLYSLQEESDTQNLSLDSKISGGGNNLSVGQRQIIALARALVRGSKLLILDEATSAIDYKTDSVIQSALRHELQGITLITVAHRLRTIMDFDRIIVMDAGRIVEFDTPTTLLQKEGFLRALVDESPDKEVLYRMAEDRSY